MEVNCEGCAGCCVDWRAVAPPERGESDHERRGPRTPLDDAYNLVPLTRDDVRGFLDEGLADTLAPRLWTADDGPGVEVDGHRVAAVDGRPVFFLGLRKPPKPVAPFGLDPEWLPTCVFLDPETLQCRIHDKDVYPEECAEYPGHNLALGAETECERVEDAFGGDRLLDDGPPEELSGLLLGPQALGQKVFAYPDPDELGGVVDRLADRDAALTDAERARFVAAAAASAPGTGAVNPERYEDAYERALAADSWAGRAVEEWGERRARSDPPDPSDAERVEDDRGAPPTPGWNG